MIHFDKHTLARWKDNGITTVSCALKDGGCEGTEVTIIEGESLGDLSFPIDGSDISCMVSSKNSLLLDDAYITHTNGKWILSSKNILTHCGCGKSFKAKTGNPKLDKFLLMKSEHEKKHHSHH